MMKKSKGLILVTLGLTACSRSDPEAPFEDEPETRVAVQEQEEGPEASQAEPERAEAAEVDGPSAWAPCPPGLVERVRSYPLLVDGAETTLGQRIDGGAIAAAIDRVDSSFVDGTWMCQADGGQALFEYVAYMDSIKFAPRWISPAPNQLEPSNLLAEAVNGTWQPTPGDEGRVRNTILNCRYGEGSLTSGAFIRIMNDEARDPAASDARWGMIPHERRGDLITYRAVLDWPSAGERGQATWIVSPGSRECEPADEAAGAINELASGIPSNRARLASGGPTPSNRPFRAESERGRALAYAFAEERELATVADWLEFHSRLEPYEAQEWEVEARAAVDGNRAVSLAIVRDGQPLRVAYRVDIISGATSPDTIATALARAVLPRRTPGIGNVVEVPTTLDQNVVDETLAGHVAGLAACIRASEASAMSFKWNTAWDGHSYNLEVTPAEPDLVECMQELFAGIEFPRVSGPAMEWSSELSLVQ